MNEAQMALMPPEYQQRLVQALRQRQLAEAQQMQSLQPLENEVVSGRVVKRNPMEFLAKGLTAYLHGKNASAAGGEATKAQQDFDSARAAELANVQGMPDPKAQIAAALASRFPGVQQYGQQLSKQREDRAGAVAGVMKEAGDYSGAINAIQQGDPNVPLNRPEPKVEYGADPAGNTLAFTRNNKGEIDFKYAPKESNVSVNSTIKGEDTEATKFLSGQLEKRQEQALAAKQTLDGVASAVDALQSGADAGGGATVFQAVRKIGDAFGIQLPQTATTDELKGALNDMALSIVQRLPGQASDKDVKFVKETAGLIDTDPAALGRILARFQAIATRELQTFQKYVKEQTGPLASEKARNLFGGAGVGYELPPQMRGPMDYQMRVLQELQSRGGDVTQFRDPTGQPFPAESQFQIQGGPIGPGRQGRQQAKPRSEAEIRKQYGLD
jgi:hypothetical protein